MYIKDFENYNNDLIMEKLDLRPLFNKLKTSINKNVVSLLIVGTLLSVFNQAQAINFIESNSDLSLSDKKELVDAIPKYKDPTTMLLSEKGWDFIRKNEKFRDHGYDLKDGMITIGFGHAEPIKTSKYKVGQIISFEDAYRLHIADVNIAAAGVKRMFNEWKEVGIKIKLTQNQYDAIVDLAYSMGVGAFRKTEFVQALKRYDLQKAAKLLYSTGISKKFKEGHSIRRMKEYRLFISTN